MKDCPQGVKVIATAPGGAARQAGRILVGDVIEQFNGRTVASGSDFIAAVRTAAANQTVKVQLLRDGRRMTVFQPLSSAADR